MKTAGAVICLVVLVCATSFVTASFVNEDVKRTIDLTGHVVTINSDVTVRSTKGSPSKYQIAIAEDVVDAVAYIEAIDEDDQKLPVKAGETSNGFQHFTVQLTKGVSKGSTALISVSVVMTHVQDPFPEEVTQAEKQLVVFEDNVYFASPYVTEKQTTTVKLASSKVESYTKEQPTKRRGSTITYGPYEDVAEYSSAGMRVHFENGTPFSTAQWSEREVEISHWGTVAVEEHYEVHNTGAVLKGGFSRLDFQMKMQRSASFQQLLCRVPYHATDLYYRDIIGNISTSAVRTMDEYKEMEIGTRFPVFGGWKTQWYQGYNMPLGKAVSEEADGSYTLGVNFGPSIVDVPIDEYEVRVVLPEGASDITVNAPFEVEEERSTRYTYLDTPTSGRVVVSLKTSNFVDAKDGELTVNYRMPPMYMLREPLMLVAAFFVLFLSYSLLSRVNLSLK